MTNYESGNKMQAPLELLTIRLNKIADTVRTESTNLQNLKKRLESAETDSDLQNKIFASETRIDLLNETLRKLLEEEKKLKEMESLKKFSKSKDEDEDKNKYFDWNEDEAKLYQGGKHLRDEHKNDSSPRDFKVK